MSPWTIMARSMPIADSGKPADLVSHPRRGPVAAVTGNALTGRATAMSALFGGQCVLSHPRRGPVAAVTGNAPTWLAAGGLAAEHPDGDRRGRLTDFDVIGACFYGRDPRGASIRLSRSLAPARTTRFRGGSHVRGVLPLQLQ